MQAPEPPFPRYKSKRILCFAYLMCSSVSWPKALKKRCLRFVMFNFSEKLQNIFEIGFKKYEVFVQKLLPLKNIYISKQKLRRHVFVVYVLINPLSKFGTIRQNPYEFYLFTMSGIQIVNPMTQTILTWTA